MSNKAADKLLPKARDYLARWKDGELYRTRVLEVLESARNVELDDDGIIMLAVRLNGIAMYRSTLAGSKFLNGDAGAWLDFLAGFVLRHWSIFTSAAVVGRTKIITELERFNSGFEAGVAFGLTSAIWLNRAEYLEPYRQWLPLIQQHKLLGQFAVDEEQIHFAYRLASERFGYQAPAPLPLREPQKTAFELLAAGKHREAYAHLLEDHFRRASYCLRYEKDPYFPDIGYGLMPVEVLALWELEGRYDESIAQIEHPLLSPLYKDRDALRAVQLEPELQFIEEACQRFITSHGGITGR
jgi:hypothetical protein